MANFTHATFIRHDDYMTPKSAWESIKDYIPKDKVLWEAFMGDGKSGKYLEELGFNVIHDYDDFFKSNKGDVLVSNPPFSKVKQVMKRLQELDKPFILIMPCSKICTQYMRETFKDKIQIIIPQKRLHFEKHVDGDKPEGWRNACNFDCFYFCHKIDLPSDIVWL